MNRQSTFDDLSKRQTLDQLTDKQKRTVRLLAEGLTQSLIAKRLGISRSSVNQIVTLLERNNLVKKLINQKYNCLYEVSPQLQKIIGGSTERLTPVRVHNIALKFSILKQDHPLNKDERTGWNKSWSMRGWEASAYWFPGKAGEINCTVSTNPRSIVIRMDAGEKILAQDKEDAQVKGFQHLIHVRQKFIDSQRLFGVHLDIESTGKTITRPHGGLAFHEGGPLDSETHIPGTWVDGSAKKELGPGFKEFEMHTDHNLLTPLERGVMAVAGIPDMIRAAIDPLHADMNAMAAAYTAGSTSQQKINEQNQMILKLMDIVFELQKEVREMKAQP